MTSSCNGLMWTENLLYKSVNHFYLIGGNIFKKDRIQKFLKSVLLLLQNIEWLSTAHKTKHVLLAWVFRSLLLTEISPPAQSLVPWNTSPVSTNWLTLHSLASSHAFPNSHFCLYTLSVWHALALLIAPFLTRSHPLSGPDEISSSQKSPFCPAQQKWSVLLNFSSTIHLKINHTQLCGIFFTMTTTVLQTYYFTFHVIIWQIRKWMDHHNLTFMVFPSSLRAYISWHHPLYLSKFLPHENSINNTWVVQSL